MEVVDMVEAKASKCVGSLAELVMEVEDKLSVWFCCWEIQ